jgi:hypothetical protein
MFKEPLASFFITYMYFVSRSVSRMPIPYSIVAMHIKTMAAAGECHLAQSNMLSRSSITLQTCVE